MGPYARLAWERHRGLAVMKLLVFYIVFVAIGEAIAYLVGRTVEHWSPPASLPVFLSLFFFMLWAAWRAAVKVA
jgi:integral membrane sensor domain MASE1